MKKETTWITTILMAIAAVLGFSALPKGRSPDTSGGGKVSGQGTISLSARATRESAPLALKGSPCWDIEKSLLIFIDAKHYAAPDTCLEGENIGKLKPDNPTAHAEIRFVVATLPDPIHTHFPLLFDRLIEALQQAAQDQGYIYDASWLPWAPDSRGSAASSASKDSSSDKGANKDGNDAQRQMQPGVLVFRKALLNKANHCAEGKAGDADCKSSGPYEAGLVMFIVGENPTGGIDRDQFCNAFEWIDVLTGTSVEEGTSASKNVANCNQQDSGTTKAEGKNARKGANAADKNANSVDKSKKPCNRAEGECPPRDIGDPRRARQKAAILGPYFSGSLPSLYQGMAENAIAKIRAQEPDEPAAPAEQTAPVTPSTPTPQTKTFPVYSGSVSSTSGIDWFNARLKDSAARFFSFQQNDDYMIDSYCLYLRNQGYDTGYLAIISEDETAYGFSLPTDENGTKSQGTPVTPAAQRVWLPDCDSQVTPPERSTSSSNNPAKPHGPLYLYYPRDIAALRSAYNQQQPSGTAQTQSSGAAGLPLDLAEPASRERDTVSTFGESRTTLSQEATLFGISNLLRSHNIQFIVLRSSNTLDQVFLTRFFTTTDPDARVVLADADLLFRRSAETAGFRGTMTLTTYPLLTWQQDWTHWQTPHSRHSHRAFPQNTAEGFYLAARFLIDGGGTVDPSGALPDASSEAAPLVLANRAIEIQDYAPPSWLLAASADSQACPAAEVGKIAKDTRPPIWISVVGNGQLWPVAVIGDGIDNAAKPRLYPRAWQTVDRSSQSPAGTLPWVTTCSKAEPTPDFPFPFPMFLCCVVLLGWSFWHFFCCLFGSHTSSIRLGNRKLSPSSFRCLAYFAPVPRPQHKWLIFIGCLIIWIGAMIIGSGTGVFHGKPYPLQDESRAIWYCGLMGLFSYSALVVNYRTFLRPEWQKATQSPSPTDSRFRRLLHALRFRALMMRVRELFRPEWQKKLPRPFRKCDEPDPPFDLPLMTVGTILFAAAAFLVFWVFYGWLLASLGRGARAFTIWRGMNIFTGVSAIAPLLLLTAGLYGWFWYSLSGLVLFNAGLPKLPREKELSPLMPMFTREGAGKRIQDAAIPLKGTFGRHFVFIALAYIAFWYLAGEYTTIHALGPTVFGQVYAVWFGLLIVLTLTESWQMLRTWGELRELLMYLDRLPIRRTLQALSGISWGTVWKMSGNVLEQRERLMSRQTESLRHLVNELARLRSKSPRHAATLDLGEIRTENEDATVPPLDQQLEECSAARDRFVAWYAGDYKNAQYDEVVSKTECSDLSAVADFQSKLASTAGVVFNRVLLPAWRRETDSLILEPSSADKDKKANPALPKDDYVKAAEEFFCMPYLGFIQNILGRIRTMTLAIVWLFVAATLSVASYPFDPRPVMSGIFLVVFFVVAAVMIFVYAEMHRDPTLSRITNTNPGELGADFWIKLITFGIGPLLGLLTALFPYITGFVTSWLQPAVGSIK